MANAKYYLSLTYKHHRTKDFPKRIDDYSFPVCRLCGKDIYIDDFRKEWACSDPKCLLS